jgi:D-glycero-D-manno-heptose 1,7-bisphosphate phosphatase
MRDKALFLDRDGVINIDYGYVSKIENFEFLEGIFEILHLFIAKGYKLFIVTNQSGIGRGYYSQEDFFNLTKIMLNEFKKNGITIEEVQYCPHAPEEKCNCRKPAIGMIDKIVSKYQIDLENSWLIGDKQSDIDLSHNANISYSVAIGERIIKDANFYFKTILDFRHYLEENQAKIV